MKLCIHSHSYASACMGEIITWRKNGFSKVVEEQQVQVQNESAQCGTMLPMLSYSRNVALGYIMHLTGLHRVITPQVPCPRRSSGSIHLLQWLHLLHQPIVKQQWEGQSFQVNQMRRR